MAQSVRKKIIGLLAINVILFVLFLMAFLWTETKRQEELLSVQGREAVERLKDIVQLQGQPLERQIDDYTCWDEVVRFISKPDPQWAVENLEAGMELYSGEGLWVYDPSFRLVYRRGEKEIPLPPSVFSQETFTKLFPKGTGLCHFYLSFQGELWELFGGTVHPTGDRGRATKPRGFFFSGRRWTIPYVEKLAHLHRSDLHVLLHPSSGGVSKDKYSYRFSLPLKGGYGLTEAYLQGTIRFTAVYESAKTGRLLLLIVLLFGLFLLLLTGFTLTRWVNTPLASLSRSLSQEDSAPLASLLESEGDFADLARLVDENFRSQRRLQEESQERERLNRRLEEQEEKLRATLNAFPGGLAVISSEYKMEFMNKRLEKEIGGDSIGKDCFQTLFRWDKVCPWCVNSRVKSGEVVKWTVKSPRDGRWYDICSAPLQRPDGEISVIVSCTDVSERKEAEEALQESEARFHQILAQVPFPMAICDTQGELLLSNSSFSQWKGNALSRYNLFKDPLFLPEKENIKRLQRGENLRISSQDRVVRALLFPVFRGTGELHQWVVFWERVERPA